MDPNGKVAIVTGGAAGIGLSIAKTFLENGVSVALLDLNKEKGEEIKKQLQEKYGEKKLDFFACNVATKEDFQGAIKKAVDRFSGLDIFVNNAGIVSSTRWENVIEVNLIGMMRGAEEALKYMSKEKGGSGGVVINIASVLAFMPHADWSTYIASKCGVIGFTRSLGTPEAYKLSGVRHIAICPGSTETDLSKGIPKELFDAMEKSLNIKLNMQRPENVAASVLEAVKSAPSGSIWITDEDEPAYEISVPHYKDLKVTSDQ